MLSVASLSPVDATQEAAAVAAAFGAPRLPLSLWSWAYEGLRTFPEEVVLKAFVFPECLMAFPWCSCCGSSTT